MKAIRYYLPLLFIIFFSISGYAQKDLEINEVFEGIGKQKGTLIKLGTDVLSPHTNIERYVSLRIKADDDIIETVESALKEDTKWAEGLLSRTDKTGQAKTMHYKLAPHDEGSRTHEYILYQLNKGYISLVYIKGNFPAKNLKKELDKLKDLFIELK